MGRIDLGIHRLAWIAAFAVAGNVMLVFANLAVMGILGRSSLASEDILAVGTLVVLEAFFVAVVAIDIREYRRIRPTADDLRRMREGIIVVGERRWNIYVDVYGPKHATDALIECAEAHIPGDCPLCEALGDDELYYVGRDTGGEAATE